MKLSELLNERKGDRSYEALERDCGGAPKAARLQQIATKPLKTFPDPESIRGLARGLKVPERVVLAAASESLGFLMPQAPSRLEQWIPSDRVGGLTSQQIDLILGVIHAITSDEPASRRVDGGASVIAVARRLGHKDPTETLRTYGHLWHDDEDRMVAATDGLVTLAAHGKRTVEHSCRSEG